MKRRVGFNGVAPPSDLLVCFPSRAHLSLLPKHICSPSRPHHHHSPRPALFRPTTTKPRNNNHRTNSKTHLGPDIWAEPTSPKVTCAGQIKVGHHKKNRDSPKNWLDALGLKKDVMNFLGVLRGLRFNMHCFGNFHGAVDCCSGDDDEEEEEEEEEKQEDEEEDAKLPPKNALLLMRCRSAPAKAEEEEEEKGGKEEERMMLMSYAPDFFKVSTEVAKETWVVGSVDPLTARSRSRSRSWRR